MLFYNAPLPIPSDSYLERVIAESDIEYSALLNSLRSKLEARYRTYEKFGGMARTMTWADEYKTTLEVGWKTLSKAAFSDIRPAIFERTKGVCYLCGNTKASELDHYLPKGKFPEYGFYDLNLIPACHRCNNKKRSRYESSGNHRYIHPNFFREPAEQFVRVSVCCSDHIDISYSIGRPAEVSSCFFEVLCSHFKDLGLATIYEDEAIQYLTEERNAYYGLFSKGGASELAEYFDSKIPSLRKVRGKNDWKAVLHSELASNEGFCNGGFRCLGPEEV